MVGNNILHFKVWYSKLAILRLCVYYRCYYARHNHFIDMEDDHRLLVAVGPSTLGLIIYRNYIILMISYTFSTAAF